MKFFKKTVAFLFSLLFMTGCGEQNAFQLPEGAFEDDILTAVPVDQNKKMVTIRYESGVPHREIENILEDEFSDIDVVMIHGGSNNSAYSIQKNLETNQEQDLIFSVDVPAINNAENYFVDLSSQKFIGQYYLSSIEACLDKNDSLYYLPGLSDIYGIVYDITMFEENGWEIPESYSDLISLVETINSSDLTTVITDENGETIECDVEAVDLSLKYADAFQIVFNTFGFAEVYKGAENQKWLQEYQSGQNSMTGHMESAVNKFIELSKAGVVDEKDFERRPWERSQAIYQKHTTAMIFENMNAEQYNTEYESDEQNRHKIGILPFYISDAPKSDFVYSIPSYYMAINKEASAESDENGKLLLDILDFLSQPQTQKKLIGDSLKLSHVQGVPPESTDFSENIALTIEEGRIITTFNLVSGDNKRTVENVMKENSRALINGEITVQEWLDRADKARDNFLNNNKNVYSYGISMDNFTRMETAQLVGNMYRELTEADVALVFVGNDNDGVTGKIYKGNITDDTFACISPSRRAYTTPSGIAYAMITGKQIKEILNGYKGSDSNDFTVASGLDVEFAPWNEPGERLISCKFSDGREISDEETYKVAYYTGSLRAENNETISVVPGETVLNGTWEENFIKWLNDKGGAIKKPNLTTTLVWEEK
ncbi:MAG: hypothetical protein E7510_10270 [Ruminococcus sp.]|nr:hypothetical protein [Ruminococcus sp.]